VAKNHPKKSRFEKCQRGSTKNSFAKTEPKMGEEQCYQAVGENKRLLRKGIDHWGKRKGLNTDNGRKDTDPKGFSMTNVRKKLQRENKRKTLADHKDKSPEKKQEKVERNPRWLQSTFRRHQGEGSIREGTDI